MTGGSSVSLPEPYYERDGITIYNADCRDVLPLLGTVDAIVTDPPYGLGELMERPGPGKWSKLWGNGAPEWDSEAPALVADLPSQARYSIIWGGNYFPLPPARGWLIWDKIVREFSSGHCEVAWTNLDQPIRAFNWSHGQLASEGKFHPTQKPVALMRWCIEFLPKDCDLILDPFMGSGTTLRAAADLGRRAIGIEINEDYCRIAVERLRQGVLL